MFELVVVQSLCVFFVSYFCYCFFFLCAASCRFATNKAEHLAHQRIAQIPLGWSCHVSTRHAIEPMHLGIEKSYDETCRAFRTARRDTLVTTSATRTTRVRGRRHSVDCGWTCPLRLMQIQSTKDLTSTREHYCFFVVRHVGTSTALHARHDALDKSYVSCRVET